MANGSQAQSFWKPRYTLRRNIYFPCCYGTSHYNQLSQLSCAFSDYLNKDILVLPGALRPFITKYNSVLCIKICSVFILKLKLFGFNFERPSLFFFVWPVFNFCSPP